MNDVSFWYNKFIENKQLLKKSKRNYLKSLIIPIIKLYNVDNISYKNINNYNNFTIISKENDGPSPRGMAIFKLSYNSWC